MPKKYVISEPAYQGICPHCANEIESALPVHPIFSLRTAARMIPCALKTLEHRLSRHKSELGYPLYKKDVHHRMFRYLRAWEIQFIRNRMTYMRGADGKLTHVFNLLTLEDSL